jgi:hypothetical protein
MVSGPPNPFLRYADGAPVGTWPPGQVLTLAKLRRAMLDAAGLTKTGNDAERAAAVDRTAALAAAIQAEVAVIDLATNYDLGEVPWE